MELTFKNALELLVGFQAFLFGVYLIFKKDGQKKSNYFIAAFIVLLAYNILDYFAKHLINQISESLGTILQITIYLAPPALYFHIKSFLYPAFILKRKHLWHILVYTLLSLVVVFLIVMEIRTGNIPERTEYVVGLIFYFILYIQIFYYLFVSHKELEKHKQVFFENYSSSDTKRYTYIKNIIYLVGFLFTLSFINILTGFAFKMENLSFVSFVVLTGVLFLFCWLIYNGLHSPELFINEDEAQLPVKTLLKKQNVTSTAEESAEIKNQIERISAYMIEKEPFMDSSLTLHSLAQETGISSRELSILINHHLNKHFFDFVNEYRIEKAMELLTASERKEYTVLEILYQVGFNSKSSLIPLLKNIQD